MDTKKVGLGTLLLVVSSVVILSTASMNSPVPLAAAGVAALGMAAGALLLGTSEGRDQIV